jgi:hypothetical protein
MSRAGIEGSRSALWRFYERHDISFKKMGLRGIVWVRSGAEHGRKLCIA